MLDFIFGSTDSKKWKADQATLDKEQWLREALPRLHAEIAAIEKRIDAGELTERALEKPKGRLAAIHSQLSRIETLKSEMIGRCPDVALQQEFRGIRSRRSSTIAAQDAARKILAQRKESLYGDQNQLDAGREKWPAAVIEEFEKKIAGHKREVAQLEQQVDATTAEIKGADNELQDVKRRMLKAKA